MMILCPYCHEEATQGAMLSLNESGGLELSLWLYDRNDTLLVLIERNEWMSDASALPWDIESGFQYLKIRQKKGDIRLEIDTSQNPIDIRANLWRKGQNIELGPRAVSFKTSYLQYRNLIFEGMCFDIDSDTGKLSIKPVTEIPMITMLLHRNVVFEDETVYLAANAYFGCTFRRCVLIMRESVSHLEQCTFDSCIWHLDLLAHDQATWDEFLRTVAPMIAQSLPRAD